MSTITRLRFTPTVTPTTRGFMAVCEEVGLASAGETEEIALLRLSDMVLSLCRAARRTGTLGQNLVESGLRYEELEVEAAPGEVLLDLMPAEVTG